MAEVEKPKQSEVKPRRRGLRFVLLSLVLAVLVLVAAPFVYLSQAGGLSGLVSNELSSRLGGAPVVVGDVGIEVRLPSFGVTLEATGVEIDLDEHMLVLPRASAVFSPQTLLKGMPSEIVLSGLDLDLSLDNEKWRSSPLGLLAGAVGTSSSSVRSGTSWLTMRSSFVPWLKMVPRAASCVAFCISAVTFSGSAASCAAVRGSANEAFIAAQRACAAS